VVLLPTDAARRGGDRLRAHRLPVHRALLDVHDAIAGHVAVDVAGAGGGVGLRPHLRAAGFVRKGARHVGVGAFAVRVRLVRGHDCLRAHLVSRCR